jgi:hypothetical protein
MQFAYVIAHGRGVGGPCNHAADEGRIKLERAVSTSVTAACREALLDHATVHFATACFGMRRFLVKGS